jgi:hypothetical protein
VVVTRPSRSRVRTEERVCPWDPAGGSFVQSASYYGAHHPLHGAEIDPGRLFPPMLRAPPHASAPTEESVILVTV